MNVTPSRSFISAFVTRSYCLSGKRFSREERKENKNKKEGGKNTEKKGGKKPSLKVISIDSVSRFHQQRSFISLFVRREAYFSLSFARFPPLLLKYLYLCVANSSQEFDISAQLKSVTRKGTKMLRTNLFIANLTCPESPLFARSRPLEYLEKNS